MTTADISPNNFIRHLIQEDLATNKHQGKVATRFPPEPNGYLHIGHAKSIVLNFGLSEAFQGSCNLRLDDTNPEKEQMDYVKAIQRDVEWLGYRWQELRFASDYYPQLYSYALKLIQMGKAYIDSSSAETIREQRGTLTQAGTDSPYRNRSIAENQDLFERMKAGEFPEGSLVLRAKIDMASPNLNMRDPTLYRIRYTHHYRTGDAWCIYPMYDYAHCISDALEGITHSLCTLEFEDHRPLYDWFLETLQTPCHPQQIEFARLYLEYTVVSKRKLNLLVQEQHVKGWDDPRMPTLAGLRRRGYTPAAIRDFCERIGITKKASQIEMSALEYSIREDLNANAARAFCVLNPLKVVLTNYPADQVESLTADNHPQRPELGSRSLPFGRELYIERDDFMVDAPKNFFRLAPGREVRLRHAYIIRCDAVIQDETGQVLELHCSIDFETLGKNPVGRKVKGVIHWVAVAHALDCEVRLYDRLFNHPHPDNEPDFKAVLNPDSLQVYSHCKAEPSLANAAVETKFQFERLGYFCVDPDSTAQYPVFNRTVSLRDSWAKSGD